MAKSPAGQTAGLAAAVRATDVQILDLPRSVDHVNAHDEQDASTPIYDYCPNQKANPDYPNDPIYSATAIGLSGC
jgi:hypothetical protein